MRRVSRPCVSRNFRGLCRGFRGLGCAVYSGRSSGCKAYALAAFAGVQRFQAAGILKDLKLDNDTSYRVRTLVEWQGKKVGADDGGEDCLKHGKEEGMKEIAKQPEPSRHPSAVP